MSKPTTTDATLQWSKCVECDVIYSAHKKMNHTFVVPYDGTRGSLPNAWVAAERKEKMDTSAQEVVVQAKDDPVNHPSHYTSGDAKCECGRTIECIDVVRHLNFNRGNVVKYVWRAGKKDDLVQELKKARWYLDDEIKRLENEPDEY